MNRIEEMILKAEEERKESFARIDENEMKRTKQVLDLFRQEGVSYRHFAPSTGYGYDDIGRDTLESWYSGYRQANRRTHACFPEQGRIHRNQRHL